MTLLFTPRIFFSPGSAPGSGGYRRRKLEEIVAPEQINVIEKALAKAQIDFLDLDEDELTAIILLLH